MRRLPPGRLRLHERSVLRGPAPRGPDAGRAHRAHRAPRLLLDGPPRERSRRPPVRPPRRAHRVRGAGGARARSHGGPADRGGRPIAPDARRTDDGDASGEGLQRDAAARSDMAPTGYDEAERLLRRRVVRAVPSGGVRGVGEERPRARGPRSDGPLRRRGRSEEQRQPVPAPLRRLPRAGERGDRRHVAHLGSRHHLPRVPRYGAPHPGGWERRPAVERVRLDGEPQGACERRPRDSPRPALLRRVPPAVRAGDGHGGAQHAPRVARERIRRRHRRGVRARRRSRRCKPVDSLRRLPRAARRQLRRRPFDGGRERLHGLADHERPDDDRERDGEPQARDPALGGDADRRAS